MYNDRIISAQRVLAVCAAYIGATDGVIGARTLAAALRVEVPDLAGDVTPERKVIAAAQVCLDREGFHPGPVDGYFGSSTEAAFASWYAARKGAGAWPSPDRSAEGPTEADLVALYGEPGNPDCSAGRVIVPWKMVLAWDNAKPISAISCHVKVARQVQGVFDRIAAEHSAAQIRDLGLHLFGGGFNLRKKRGGDDWSTHSWGVAFDFDPARNRLRWRGDRARLALPDAENFWRAWEDAGWTSLGRARGYDYMHVQAVGV